MFSQPDSSQEFLDVTKFYGCKNQKNLKRIILKSKRAVSERETFLEKEGKIYIAAETELKPTVALGERLLWSYDLSVVNLFTWDETFVKNNLTFLSDSGTIQQSNSDKESYILNNEQKALINKKKKHLKVINNKVTLLCETSKKKTVSYEGSLQCRSFLQARE